MKIAVVGTGAIGSFYGGKLAHEGRDVHFLLRSGIAKIKRSGIRIRGQKENFHVARVQCYETASKGAHLRRRPGIPTVQRRLPDGRQSNGRTLAQTGLEHPVQWADDRSRRNHDRRDLAGGFSAFRGVGIDE